MVELLKYKLASESRVPCMLCVAALPVTTDTAATRRTQIRGLPWFLKGFFFIITHAELEFSQIYSLKSGTLCIGSI